MGRRLMPAVARLLGGNEIWSARVAHLVQNASQFGTITGLVGTDMAKVRSRERGITNRDVAFHRNDTRYPAPTR